MSQSAPPQDATSVITQEFFVDPPCPLAVNVPGAVTTIRPGSDSDRAEVTVSVVGCSSADAEQLFDRLELDARQVKGTIRITSDLTRTDTEWWRWLRTFDGTLHVEVTCPSPVEADLTIPGGEIDIADLKGTFTLSLMGTPCRLDNLEGDLSLRGESSDVSIEQFTGDELTARVAVGSLSLTDVTADLMSWAPRLRRSCPAPATPTSR